MPLVSVEEVVDPDCHTVILYRDGPGPALGAERYRFPAEACTHRALTIRTSPTPITLPPPAYLSHEGEKRGRCGGAGEVTKPALLEPLEV